MISKRIRTAYISTLETLLILLEMLVSAIEGNDWDDDKGKGE